MPKLATAQGKVERINEQITEAQTEFEGLKGEVTAIEDALTKELGKVSVDEARVNQLEADRENFIKTQARLSARVAALEVTLPDNEKLVAKAELKAAIVEHGEATDRGNEALKSYKNGLELLRSFVKMYHSLIDARVAASDLKDKIDYFSELLQVKKPELRIADKLTDQEDKELADVIRSCVPLRSEIDPWRSSPFKVKLNELRQEAHDKTAAEAAIENKRVAQLAG